MSVTIWKYPQIGEKCADAGVSARATPILDAPILEEKVGAAGAAAVAIRKRREREVRAEFLRAGAINPASAMSLHAVGADTESRTVKRLRKRAIIREAAPGLFYFDDDVWQAFRQTQRRIALVLLIAIVLTCLVVTYGVVTNL